MKITDLIKKHGGTTKFRKALEEKGVKPPALQTVKDWSATGNTHSDPPQYALDLLEKVLSTEKTKDNYDGN